jgi:hypothetical protein
MRLERFSDFVVADLSGDGQTPSCDVIISPIADSFADYYCQHQRNQRNDNSQPKQES